MAFGRPPFGPRRRPCERRRAGARRATARRACVAALLWASVAGSACAPQGGDEWAESELRGEIFGTTWSVKVVGREPLREEALIDLRLAISEELEGIDAEMSTWRDDSDLMRFNASSGTEPVPVPERFAEVLALSLDVWRSSGGAFDVTVGPLVELWGFGRARALGRTPSLPDERTLAELRPAVGSRLLELERRPDGSATLRKLDPRVQVDLSAVAKGYAVDRVLERSADLGHTDVLVEIGGEIAAIGLNRERQPWVLAIERPIPGARAVQRLLRVTSPVALATSGDYRNFYIVEGRRYTHTLDPRSGRPVSHDGASVSVLAENCATADAWATALLALGPDEGHALAEELGLAALFLIHGDGDDVTAVEERTTTAFDLLAH